MLIGLGKMIKKVTSTFSLLASRVLGSTYVPGTGGSSYYTTTVVSGFSGSIYVKGGYPGLYYSTDGVTWKDTDAPSGYYRSVAYANKIFIANHNSKIFYSTDGAKWTEANISSALNYIGATSTYIKKVEYATFNGGLKSFIAYVTGGLIYSDNGIDWSGVYGSKPGVTMSKSQYFQNYLYTVGRSNIDSGIYQTINKYGPIASASIQDHINRTFKYLDTNTNWGIGVRKNYIFTGNSDTIHDSYSSTYDKTFYEGDWRDITAGSGVYVAASYDGKFATSLLGQTNFTVFPVSGQYLSIAYGNGKFVAVGYGSIAYSNNTNFFNTSDFTVLSTAQNYHSVTYGNGYFVAVGMGVISYSSDGINWTNVSNAVSTSFNKVVYLENSGKFAAVGNYYMAFANVSDLSSWTYSYTSLLLTSAAPRPNLTDLYVITKDGDYGYPVLHITTGGDLATTYAATPFYYIINDINTNPFDPTSKKSVLIASSQGVTAGINGDSTSLRFVSTTTKNAEHFAIADDGYAIVAGNGIIMKDPYGNGNWNDVYPTTTNIDLTGITFTGCETNRTVIVLTSLVGTYVTSVPGVFTEVNKKFSTLKYLNGYFYAWAETSNDTVSSKNIYRSADGINWDLVQYRSGFGYLYNTYIDWLDLRYTNGKLWLMGSLGYQASSTTGAFNSWTVTFEDESHYLYAAPDYGTVDTLTTTEVQVAIGNQGTEGEEILAPVIVYTVPDGKTTELSSIEIENTSSYSITVDICILSPSEEFGWTKSYIWDYPVLANSTEILDSTNGPGHNFKNPWATLTAETKVVVLPSSVDAVEIKIYGTETDI